jgi:signal transduction histidine kinase
VSTEGEQLVEALSRGEVDAVISRNQLYFLRLREVEEALRLSREELEQRVRDGTEKIASQGHQMRRLATELTKTEQRERSRLAEVLHGHVQQLLVAINLNIALLQGKTTSPDTVAHLEKIRFLVEDCIKATRILSVELTPPILSVGGLSAAIEWLAKWMHDNYGLQVRLELDSQAHCEPEDVSVVLFQSVRELLFNVVKHAGVLAAAVSMDVTEDARLRITVSDEGAGFDPSASCLGGPGSLQGGTAGFGLCHVRERLTLLGGQFFAESEPGKWSRFVLIVPLSPI